jgi:hypothetical protein
MAKYPHVLLWGGNDAATPCFRAIYGEELSTDARHRSGDEGRSFSEEVPTMIGLILMLLISVCLIFAGYKHAEASGRSTENEN